jgi:dihydrodipicolinate synthase/N-acetylneuraminate lyase
VPRYPQGVMVSCTIPWDNDEQLVEPIFRDEIRRAIAARFKHIYIFGTAGEGYAVDTPRFQQAVRIFWEETSTLDLHALVGVIGLSTAQVKERIDYAHRVGFREFQIVLPSWGVLSDADVLRFFSDVCLAYPDSMFLHYNLPRSKRVLNGADYARITPTVPNLVATKTTSGEMPGAVELLRNAPELQHFMGERNFPHGILEGECSLLASWAWLSPERSWALFEAGREGRIGDLFRLQHEFYRVSQDLFGSLRSDTRIDGAYDKLILKLGCLEEMPLRLLSPYSGFTEADYRKCLGILRERHSDWISSAQVAGT